MRRIMKHGIYSNKTVRKRGQYLSNYGMPLQYCYCCKSPCKCIYINNVDPDSVPHNHLIYQGIPKKLHQLGSGSIIPGKFFRPFGKKMKRDGHQETLYRENKKYYLIDLKTQLEIYNFELYADSL